MFLRPSTTHSSYICNVNSQLRERERERGGGEIIDRCNILEEIERQTCHNLDN
jgi:hypothetical protein